jgi:hypothetical protein
MKRSFILFIGLLFIFNAGCKKEIQQPDEEVPVFYFNGKVNAAPVNLQAGVNEYYMYSFFKQDSITGLYSFWGNIKQVNCAHCTNHITFKIFDAKVSKIGEAAVMEKALELGTYTYELDTASSARKSVAFTSYSSPGDTVQSYSWTLGDGTTSNLPNPTHTYNIGNYNVCLQITYKNGCLGTSCNTVIVGPSNANDCAVEILDTARSGNVVTFDAVPQSINPVTYNWNFNDSASGGNNISTLKYIDHNFSAPGIYRVYVEISNIGCSARVYKNIATPNFTNGCFANYTFMVLPTNQLPFSKLTIYWADAAGVIYSSEKITQPADSYFEILSVDEYNLNENKQRTKKIHAKLKCLLSDGKSSIPITDSDAIFAISFR